MQQIERIRRARLGLGQAERLVRASVRVAAQRERGEVLRQQVDRVAVRVGEPEQVALQVRDAVRAVGVPDEHALAARGRPVECARQRRAAGQVWRGARCPVVRDRQVAHARPGEHERKAGRRARHVGLHRRDDLDPVAAQLGREAEQSRELVDRRRLGVEGERQRARLEAPAAQVVEHHLARRTRPSREPALQRQVALDRPAKAVVGRGQVERFVEVVEVVAQHAALRVGVAEVEMRVVDEVDAPATLWLELELVAAPQAIPELALEPHEGRPVDGWGEQPHRRRAFVELGGGRVESPPGDGEKREAHAPAPLQRSDREPHALLEAGGRAAQQR